MHKKYVRFKRDLNRRSERLKTRPRGESTEKGRGKAEIQNELLPLSKKHSQGKQSACFSAEEFRRLKGRLGCAEGGGEVQKKGKSGGPFENCCGRKSETKSFECGTTASAASKNFPPLRCRKFLHSFVAKAQKRQRLHFCFCAWFGTAVGCRGYFLNAEVPFRRTLQNKRAGARKFKRKGNKGVAHTAGAEMTGEPKKRRKSKKCRLQPAGQSCGNR